MQLGSYRIVGYICMHLALGTKYLTGYFDDQTRQN